MFGTAEELRELIGKETITAPRAEAMLRHATAVIRRHTGQFLSEVLGDVVTFPITRGDTLFLPELPVTAVTVEVDGQPFTDFTFTASGVLSRKGWWARGATVTYDHGYEADSPEMAAIKAVCLEMAARAFTLNKRSEFEEYGGTASEASGWAPEVIVLRHEAKLLNGFTRVPA